MKKITVSAPGKLMLLGEHAVVYNRPCIVTAVGQRMFVTLETLSEPKFELEAADVKVTRYKKPFAQLGEGDIPKGATFVEVATKNFTDKYPLQGGIRITTRSEFSSLFGFGSSSASTVCVIKGLTELTNTKLSNKAMFDLAYKTVLDIQGKGSGFDVAAAIYGGTLYFVTAGKVIAPLSVDLLPLIVGYSGIKADTVTLISRVNEFFANRQDRLNTMYDTIEVLVNQAKDALVNADWVRFGTAMNNNQGLLKELGVSTGKLDAMIQASLNEGAYGAKLSGAGGGDCMIALVSPEKVQTVSEAITAVGGQVITVSTNVEGVKIEV